MATRTRDWKALDAAHRRRGELITVVFDPAGQAFSPPGPQGRRGRPCRYSDALIEGLLLVKVMLRLSLRAVEGFAHGMARIAQAQWPIPNYSTLSRREARLQVDLQAKPAVGKRHVLMVDSTGLKVFGEGEWKVRQHGTEGKRRTWRKIHLLVDRESGHVVAVEMTEKNVNDNLVLPALLPVEMDGDAVLGDGAYHTKALHREVHRRGGRLLSPPKVGARRWGKTPTHNDEEAFVFRNSQVRAINELGRPSWKLRSGMSRRSYVESMMHRLKSLTGSGLSARTWQRQVVEVRLRCKALNGVSTSTMSITA